MTQRAIILLHPQHPLLSAEPTPPTPVAPASGLGSVTFERRRRMTAAELIELMGPLHVNHPAYKPRPSPLLPVPNLAGLQPVVEHSDVGLFGEIRTLIAWALR